MTTIHLPTHLQNTDVAIALTLQPVPPSDTWADDFFTDIIGGWDGEPLQRPDPRPDSDRLTLNFGD